MQLRSKQAWVSWNEPWQYCPPRAGGGLLHKRVRVLDPLPQVLVQEDQVPQDDQFPFTGTAKELG